MSLIARITALAQAVAADIKSLVSGKLDKTGGALTGDLRFAYAEAVAAATLDLGAITGNVVQVQSGAAPLTITSFGVAPAGVVKIVTRNSSRDTYVFVQLGSENIKLGWAGDEDDQITFNLSWHASLVVLSEGDGLWVVVAATTNDGRALRSDSTKLDKAGGAMTGRLSLAPPVTLQFPQTQLNLADLKSNTIILSDSLPATARSLTEITAAPYGTRITLVSRSNFGNKTIGFTGNINTFGYAVPIVFRAGAVAVYEYRSDNIWYCVSFVEAAGGPLGWTGTDANGATWSTRDTSTGSLIKAPVKNTLVTAPATDSPTITFSAQWQNVYNGGGDITAGGHIVGSMGWAINSSAKTVAMAIGAEGRFDSNNGSAVTTQGVGVLGLSTAQQGTVTNAFGVRSELQTVAGATITAGYGYGAGIGSNLGTLSSYTAYYMPTLTGTMPAKLRFMENMEPRAPIVSKAPIVDQAIILQAPGDGFAYPVPELTSYLQMVPTAALATGTLQLPTNPLDGQVFTANSSLPIAALTVVASGAVVVGGSHALSSNSVSYKYVQATNTWYRQNISDTVAFNQAQNAVAPNDAVPVAALLPVSGVANTDIAIVLKGTGALTLNVPDGAQAGGNKRGSSAIDLQPTRNSATQVASGNTAVILGGNSNTASGFRSAVVAGQTNVASGSVSAVLGGASNTAAGSYSLIAGGLSNYASSMFSSVLGGNGGNTRDLYGVEARANGYNSILGDSQRSRVTMRGSTSNTTPGTISANNSAVSATNTFVLPDSSAFHFTAKIVARAGMTNDAAGWTVTGVVSRGSGASTVALVGTPTVTANGKSSGASAWAVGAAVNTTLGALTFTVTGSATSIRWVADVETVEVVG